MTLKIEVKLDNAAFQENPYEVKEILEKVARTFNRGEDRGRILDSNGNTVGKWTVR